jgi:uncharacterized protein (TIGR02452 family)
VQAKRDENWNHAKHMLAKVSDPNYAYKKLEKMAGHQGAKHSGVEEDTPDSHIDVDVTISPVVEVPNNPTLSPRAGPWDAAGFTAEILQAKRDKNWNHAKQLLAKVAEHNYACRDLWRTPRTVYVAHEECRRLDIRRHLRWAEPRLSISTMTTAEACQHFARHRENKVCALNFANGQTVGGGYKNGATAQEEDLCRQFPTLYSTLYNAAKEGMYHFGPSTALSPSEPERYSDVLFTAGLTLARSGAEDGYRLLDRSEEVEVAMVAAAAPNIRFAKEISDKKLICNTMESIFTAPFVWLPETNVLILGAWGCGAFGGNPKEIAELFVRVLWSDRKLANLYKEIHFAIPKLSTTDDNHDEFLKVFREFQLPMHDFDQQQHHQH